MTTDTQGYPRQAQLSSDENLFNQLSFMIQQALGIVGTNQLVLVTAVDSQALDVQPLVKLMDGEGNTSPRGKAFGLIYLQPRAGISGIGLIPEVGDIGLACICDRDISAVKAARAQAQPGSRRRFSISDGIYLGTVLPAAVATQFINFTESGIEIVVPAGRTIVARIDATKKIEISPTSVSMVFGSNSAVVDATGIHFNGQVFFNDIAQGPTSGATVNFGSAALQTTGAAQVGSVVSTGQVTGNGIALSTHVHSGVQGGGGSSGPPVP